MKLSIILTVYNKEPYLHRALESLLRQENVHSCDYEIIIVNDGSTDNSLKIIEEYANSHPIIRVISQDNQGLSMARNNGLLHSNGEYIWFVDADDIISNYSVSLVKNIMPLHPDVIPIYAETIGVNKIRNQINPNVRSGKDILLGENWEHCAVFWIFRKKYLTDNNLFFLPKIYHEDAEFTPRMLYLAKSIRVLPEVLYRVYQCDENSITSIPTPKRAYDMVNVIERLMIFFTEEIQQKTLLGKKICDNNAVILNYALYVISLNDKKEKREFDIYLYNKKHLLGCFIEASKLKYNIEGFILKCFAKHYTSVYSFMRIFSNAYTK